MVVRAQGRPDGDRLPAVGLPPHPGRSHGGAAVRWIEDGALLAVTTWGSSSHPVVPRTVRVADGELTLTLTQRRGAPPPPGFADVMSADLAAHTTLIEPPAGLDPRARTAVHLGDQLLELPPAGTPLSLRVPLRPGRPGPPPV